MATTITVTGARQRGRVALVWENGDLSSDDGVALVAVLDLVAGRRPVSLLGLADGLATVAHDAEPALIAATLAAALDDVDSIDMPEPDPLPPGALP